MLNNTKNDEEHSASDIYISDISLHIVHTVSIFFRF